MIDLVAWLAAPIDPSRAHVVGFAASWHGRMMVLAWCFLFPVGILAARFFKITPKQDWPRVLDNAAWWHTHLACQYAGGLLMLVGIGLALAIPAGAGPWASLHRLLGWTVAALAALQFAGGWLRGSKGGPTAPAPDGSLRGDHYDMTRRRRAFEHLHKSAGYVALTAAFATIPLGLWLANGPRWMWLGLLAWWIVLIGAFAVLQHRGYAFDTYQAIWGSDPRHPGNRVTPIGLGITRSRSGVAGRPRA